jgi:hypothetical protein
VIVMDALIRDVLARLQMLADGGTINLNPDRVSSSATESSAPEGVTFRPSGEEPRKEHVSLYEFYRWQFEHHSDDPKMLRTLWMLACDDYEDFRFKADHLIEVRKGEKVENDPKDPGAAERAQAERVVDWYEGRPPLYVATRESLMAATVTEGWVRKARRQHGRDPETGRPRPEFYEWDEERRSSEVAALATLGLGAKAIGAKLGVDKNTVKRYMVAREPVAA